MNKSKTITIPEHLHRKLEEHRQTTAFASLNDLITFVLQDYLDQQEQPQNSQEQDEASLKKRLRDLGYM